LFCFLLLQSQTYWNFMVLLDSSGFSVSGQYLFILFLKIRFIWFSRNQ
jgi:hypothetical protein